MNKLTLTSERTDSVTVLSNNFIDTQMCEANGEFVKIYLYLLRCLQAVPRDFSLLLVADKMNLTEGDVLRALKYWEQKGLLSFSREAGGRVSSICFLDKPSQTAPAAERFLKEESTPGNHPKEDAASRSLSRETFAAKGLSEKDSASTASPKKSSDSLPKREETPQPQALQELVLIAEQYLKRQLTAIDFEKITYFYEELHFSQDLIEYLFEHCVTVGNRSIRYIESVATAWADKGIRTVKQAKEEGQQYRREYFTIMKAFGIRGRNPIDNEVQYMKKWLDDYHFTTEVICEACQRTIANTGNPVFAYADSILKNWKKQGILAKRDIAAADQAHQKEQSARQAERAKKPAASNTRFNNFEQRSEYDFNELEKRLNLT